MQAVRSIREAACVDSLPKEACTALCDTLHVVWGQVQDALVDPDQLPAALQGLKTLQAAPLVTVEALARDGLGKAVRMLSKQGGEVGDGARDVLRVWKTKLIN